MLSSNEFERRLRILESGDRREAAESLHEIADKFRGERETGEVDGFLETGTDRGTAAFIIGDFGLKRRKVRVWRGNNQMRELVWGLLPAKGSRGEACKTCHPLWLSTTPDTIFG